ncbi:MAG: LUD domain-containing protein [Acidimicrobiia bacterium]
MDRERFLERVAASMASGRVPAVAPFADRLPEMGQVDLLALFGERARSVDAQVHGPVARYRVPAMVTGLIASTEPKTFVAWDDLPVPGVPAALAADGWLRLDHRIGSASRLEDQLAYSDLAVGLTGAMAGLAESGSVVLDHGQGRPRMASLIPETHVVLLEASSIARTLSHWAEKNPDSARRTANLVVITGPSRTGDIELQLNLGVHGPRQVHIVVIE